MTNEKSTRPEALWKFSVLGDARFFTVLLDVRRPWKACPKEEGWRHELIPTQLRLRESISAALGVGFASSFSRCCCVPTASRLRARWFHFKASPCRDPSEFNNIFSLMLGLILGFGHVGGSNGLVRFF